MILLIPDNWIAKDNVLTPDIGALLNAIFMSVYEEPLGADHRWWRVIKPEGFPWAGDILDFQSPNDRHNQLVAVFHNSAEDGVILNAALALGFESIRSAKLLLTPSTADNKGELSVESPQVWYGGIKLNGVDVAVRTIAELTGHVKLSDKSIH